MLPRIYFIRHGETAWSLSGQYTSHTDLALTAHGEQSARNLCQHLRGVHFARVLTSPRQRARRTCELAIAQAIPEIEPDLAEWDYGDHEGRHSSTIRQEHPQWNLFRDGCPNGESSEQISLRVDRLIAKLRLMGGNIALFSHAHLGRVLAARWIGLPVTVAQHFLLSPTSISILDFEHNQPDAPAIALWNEESGN